MDKTIEAVCPARPIGDPENRGQGSAIKLRIFRIQDPQSLSMDFRVEELEQTVKCRGFGNNRLTGNIGKQENLK
jgi:hypothetical protein